MRALLPLLLSCVWVSCRTAESSSGSEVANMTPSDSSALVRDENALRSRLLNAGLTEPCPTGQTCATLIQMNDVSEIDGIAGGQYGGLDRVATVRRILAEPQVGAVIMAVTGDFLHPSGLGTLKEDGKPLSGRHMIAVLKAAGVNLAIFGNHEFDLDPTELQARLDEGAILNNPDLELCQHESVSRPGLRSLSLSGAADALVWERAESRAKALLVGAPPPTLTPRDIICHGVKCTKAAIHIQDPCLTPVLNSNREPAACFAWIASNLLWRRDKASAAEPWSAANQKVPRARILEFGSGERPFRIGFVGITHLKNQKDFVQFSDITTSAQQLVTALRNGIAEHPSVDAIVALTHMSNADDIALLEDVPGIDLSLGGQGYHESINCVGETSKRCIAKADANARSVYVHRLVFDPKASNRDTRLTIRSELIPIDVRIPRDPKVKRLIDCYFQQANLAASKATGKRLDLRQVIAKVMPDALDGTATSVRRISGSNLTARYAHAMLEAARNAAADGQPFSLALIHGGAFRGDDFLGPGLISHYDALRMLPFGGKLVTASITISDLAAILYRSWLELPPGSGGILHVYPELPVLDRPRQEISLREITDNLLRLAGAQNAQAAIRLVTTEYLLKFGEQLSPEARAKFVIRDDPLKQVDMRELLAETLRSAYPL